MHVYQAMLEIIKAPVKLSELLTSCIKLQATKAVDITFVAGDENISVNVDKNYLTIVINNLLQNSIRYGRGVVIVSIEKKDAKVIFTVEDNGLGISEAIRKDILKPFVRGNATKHTVKGHGIGLAIVKRILDWHQGQIEISDSVTLG